MSTLSQVWSEVETLLSDNISLIPVRDKDEINKYGETLVAKSAYGKWKEFQNRKMTKDELWHALDQHNTTAVAIICGKISGNMEVLDIDVKYNPGIDAILFTDLQNFYPDLFSKLRIHKTPSGGYHIIYRVNSNHPVPGNLKLAGRYATDEEIQAQIDRGSKRPNKEVNFLETRAEGGYILAPPSLGYAVHQDHPIPLISWEERCSLIRLCESYTTIIKEAPKPKPTKSEESWYDENPFEHYNRATDPTELVTGFGWKYSHENNFFIWYTRPDKQRGVSLSWNKEKQIFYVFTSSTELQSNKGYHPSSILAELGFAGDKGKTYRWLIDNGFGIVKPSVEASIIKKAAHSNGNVPANFSDRAKEELQQQSEQLKKDHPFGEFIKYDGESEKTTVSYEALLYVAKMLGLLLYENDVVYLQGHVVERITDRKMQDILKSYIHEEDAEEYERLCNVFEKFLKENTNFIKTRLSILDKNRFIKDCRNTCYKFYTNGFLKITTDNIEFLSYENFEHLIWKDTIQPREYGVNNGGRFVEYLNLALVKPDDVRNVLGFLSHEFKDETTGYIIVLTEACSDPKYGGGSGKNVFCNLLNLTTTYSNSPGSQGKFDEKFFQSWNYEKVFGINDLPKNFDFANLKEAASGTIKLKKLWSNEQNIGVENAPKLITQTNFSYVNTDGGLKRRIIPVEFTDFFTKCGGLDVHFGVHFPKGWTIEDYQGFDNYIAESIQIWIRGGCKLKVSTLSDTGWLKQWEQTYGNATGFILKNWNEWIKLEAVANSDFKNDFENYYNENNIIGHYRPSSNKINDAIKSYGLRFGYGYKSDFSKRVNSVKSKYRVFFKVTDAEPISDDSEDEEVPF